MNKVSICACVIWLIGFTLSFIVKPDSPDIGWPDFFLLLGFLPLLISYKPTWPWFVFGIGNIVIGFTLQTTQFVPTANLPSTVLPVKDHLDHMHKPLVWILFGFFSIAYGVLRLLKKLIIHFAKTKKKD